MRSGDPFLKYFNPSDFTNRSMILSINEVSSILRSLPGSTPLDGVLGIFLFVVMFNGAALRPRLILNAQTRNISVCCYV